MPNWIRYRFQANADDPRPVKWPPAGPYWVSGYAIGPVDEDEYTIVIAYLPESANLTDYWPEADEITTQEKDKIEYFDRFPRPEWWQGE